MTDQTKLCQVLLVEDSEADCELLIQLMRQNGFQGTLFWARDGEEALSYLLPEATAPHLVILDLGLPKINGYEVLQTIRKTPHTAELPVVILTTSRMADDIFRCQGLGISRFQTKPSELCELEDLARQLVRFSEACVSPL